MILVTGATGKVGGEAVRLLAAESGSGVRAFVRSPEKAAPLRQSGAEIAQGDFVDMDSLEAALEAVTTVVLSSPGDPAQERNVVEAAVRAGVEHIVYLTSKASLDAPIERRRWHAQTEQVIESSGIPFTLLRSNAFMQNTLALAPAIRATGGFRSAAATGRMGMVDSRDVAAVAAAIARDPGAHAGRTYLVTGPEAITYEEVASILGDLLGRSVEFAASSLEADRDGMIAAGIPAPVATMNAQAFSLIAHGDADWVSGDVAAVTGRPARGYRTFATDYLDAFAG